MLIILQNLRIRENINADRHIFRNRDNQVLTATGPATSRRQCLSPHIHDDLHESRFHAKLVQLSTYQRLHKIWIVIYTLLTPAPIILTGLYYAQLTPSDQLCAGNACLPLNVPACIHGRVQYHIKNMQCKAFYTWEICIYFWVYILGVYYWLSIPLTLQNQNPPEPFLCRLLRSLNKNDSRVLVYGYACTLYSL